MCWPKGHHIYHLDYRSPVGEIVILKNSLLLALKPVTQLDCT